MPAAAPGMMGATPCASWLVLAGPDVEKEGLSAYTRDDIARIIMEKWILTYDPTSVGRILRSLGFSRQKARPSHPTTDPEAAEAFSKDAGRSAATCRYTSGQAPARLLPG